MKLLTILLALSLAASSETLDTVWRGGYGEPRSEAPKPIRLLTWNIERGLRFDEVLQFLQSHKAHLALLQEVDVNARRSGSRRVHEELAKRLGMQYAFAPEFQELGQQAGSKPAWQGQALLCAARITAARSIRFQEQSDFWRARWYLPNWAVFQRRLGGRVALLAEVAFGTSRLVIINAHLESRGPESLRLAQMNEILGQASAYQKDRPVILAGDLNVNGVSSPVIRAIESAGFQRANGGEVTTDRGAPLDWIFVKGVTTFRNARIHRDITAADHYPVSVDILLR